MMSKPMTIHDIAQATKATSPHFFSPNNMRFFGQVLEDFTVEAMDDGRYRISAPVKSNPYALSIVGWPPPEGMMTVRYFNPVTNELEHE